MSAVGEIYILPSSSVERVREGVGAGTLDSVLRKDSTGVVGYNWSGYVLATLLAYLEEQGVPLMNSDYDDVGTLVSQGRGVTSFVLEPAHRRFLDVLDPGRYDPSALQSYYEEFNQTSANGVGQAMVDGIAMFRDALARIDERSVGLLIIG
jgi:hypothetical protein